VVATSFGMGNALFKFKLVNSKHKLLGLHGAMHYERFSTSFFLIMFSFGFNILLNCIKYYVHGVLGQRRR
jgi:hypothetical protein